MQFAVKNKENSAAIIALSLFFINQLIKHPAIQTYGAVEVFLTSALDRGDW
jgi:hypothetical protein